MMVLLVSEYFHPYGGAELSLWKLSCALTERGHTVYVITSRRSGEAAREVKEGIEIVRPFGTGNLWRRLLFSLKLFPYLDRWLKGRHIDVVYNLGFVPTVPATWAARKHGILRVTMLGHFCGTGWFRLRNPLAALFNCLTETLAIRFGRHQVLVVQCQATARKVARRTGARVKVVCNTFIDPQMMEEAKRETDSRRVRDNLAVEEGAVFLLMAGGLIPTKNIPTTIKALAGWGKEFKLVLAGEGPERRRIENVIDRARMQGRVVLLGRRSHAETLALMRACDALLMTSICEQVPNVVLEALALGRPVIATRVGGIPEINSANLHLIDRLEEIPALLDDGIRAVEEDTIAEEYLLDSIVEEYEELFSGLARERERRR